MRSETARELGLMAILLNPIGTLHRVMTICGGLVIFEAWRT
jgi:hypothetical protein